jgi:peptidoglycan/LPS O-acetylase OafA/YrhL
MWASPARLAYLADSSYWVYLVHLPLTIGLGALLYGLPIQPWPRC